MSKEESAADNPKIADSVSWRRSFHITGQVSSPAPSKRASTDDAMAIFVALRSPEVEVIGLTTIYGNVCTTLATRNALHLLEVAGRTDIPVAEGSHVTITKGTKLRRADFVHGADGLGNQNFPPPEGKPIEQSAAAFLVQKANLYPGKVTVVALGPLTNIALAIQLDPAFVKNIGQIVVLGGAFAVNGSVNPAAETNFCSSQLSLFTSFVHGLNDQIFGDPDAADIVFTSGADVLAVGINVTHQVVLTGLVQALTKCQMHTKSVPSERGYQNKTPCETGEFCMCGTKTARADWSGHVRAARAFYAVLELKSGETGRTCGFGKV
ncbi:hypothetical protein TEA_018168 [Camellia sinensis var. sinensis]|uniref:Inosine/uridine-preferring nucleoside hydrolase domain-containing protein n=1 Tax=Camellia sinensis var. sinensis TaxID=542762 RepID=A0A4S4D1Z3_CAMSN|nr:hypothetical protein TEA_018168 [Camellia sinensis var. sinensis]